MLSEDDRERIASAPPEVIEQLDVQARYEGYIRRQLAEIRRHRATETLPVPHDFDYWPLEGLTYEAKDKLSRLRPATLGQASRVPGVSPADISVLLVHLYRHLRSEPDSDGDDDAGERGGACAIARSRAIPRTSAQHGSPLQPPIRPTSRRPAHRSGQTSEPRWN